MLSFAKRFVLAGALFAMLLPAGVASATSPTDVPETNPVVAKVNGEEIRLANVQSATDAIIPMVTYHSSISDERFRELQKRALSVIIEDMLMYDYAVANGLDKIDKKRLKEEIKEIEKRVPKGTTLEKMLEKAGMTMDDIRAEIKHGLVVKEMRTVKKDEFQKKAEETVTDEYMRNYYDNNLSKFKEPENLHVRELLIKADPGGGQKAWNASKKKAQELKDKILAGEDFAKIAKEFSEDIYAEKGGDMGWAHVGSLDPGIEELAKSLEIGEVGGPVMSIYGYHIIKIEGRKPSVQKKYEELNIDSLRSDFTSKEYKQLWKDWLDELKGQATIEYVSERFKDME